MQTITRHFEFDAGHRVLNEKFKCFAAHGHRYTIDLVYSFEDMHEIGYVIDFKEIKRVGCMWIDDMMDHSFIINPEDLILKKTLEEINTPIYVMSLMGDKYCNPTVENIGREIFLAQSYLFESYEGLEINEVILYETPNCWTNVVADSIPSLEKVNFRTNRYDEIRKYATEKGIVEYDDRKI